MNLDIGAVQTRGLDIGAVQSAADDVFVFNQFWRRMRALFTR